MAETEMCDWCDASPIVTVNGVRGCREHLEIAMEAGMAPVRAAKILAEKYADDD